MNRKQVFNPYLPAYEYIPDGEPRVFGDRLYIFGSHDKFGGNNYCLNDYVCWSCPIDDLSDWRYEGVIYRKDQDPRSQGKISLYAPDVVKGIDGRYYLYYSVENSSVISVAVCDSPAGRYEYYGDIVDKQGRVIGESEEDPYDFDPAVLVDDDGRVWLYSGSGQKFNKKFGSRVAGAFVRELESDMRTTIGEPKIIMPFMKRLQLFRPGFFEGSSIRKINGLYYFIYAATDASGLNYLVSKYPDRDFTYGGCIHNSSDIGIGGHHLLNAAYPVGNYHGSIVEINKKYYIFDHRQTNNTTWCRQGTAEEIVIQDDGSIRQVESTSCGLNGGPLEGIGVYPAYICCNLMKKKIFGIRWPIGGPCVTQSGDDREDDPDSYIMGITNGTVAGFKHFKFSGSEKRVRLRVRGTLQAEKTQGCIYIRFTEKGRNEICVPVKFEAKGGSDSEWTDIEGPCRINSGVKPVFFEYRGKGTVDFKEFEFS